MPTQGSERLAKDDTLFYGVYGAVLDDMATDLSQYGVDWTRIAGVNAIHSADAARYDRAGDRSEVAVRFEMTNAPGSTVIYAQGGDPATEANSHGIYTSNTSGQRITVWVASTLVASFDPPNISASSDAIQIVWTSMPNPDTTGASDAMLSEVQCWNAGSGGFTKVSFVHADFPTPGSYAMFFGAYNTSGDGEYVDGDFISARVSSGRWHSTSEGREDWIAQTTAPTLSLETYREPLLVPSGVLDADGHAHGPEALMCSAAVRQAKLRLVGPAVNQTMEDRTWILPGLSAVDAQDRLTFDTDYVCPLWYMRMAKIPDVVNRCRVRVFMQHDMDVTASDTGDDETVVSFWTGERRPTSSADTDFEYFQSEVTLDTDEGSAATGGSWADFGEMRVSRDEDGFMYMWIGFDFNGTAQDQRIRVKSIAVDLGYDDVSGGELPVGGLGG